MDLPIKYIERMKILLGKEFQSYMASFGDPRHYGLRVNTLKISAEEFLNKNKFDLQPVKWCSEGFYYDENERPAKHPYYHCGLYYLQEPSAMSSAAVLPVNTGDFVLDLCAAPGGKTTQLASKLKGTGIIWANDISAGRTKALVKNIELMGIKNAVVTSENPEKLAEKLGAVFDKVLVDAPCSGEGMFRKEKDIIKAWDDEMLSFCVNEQMAILENAAKLLKKDGYLLYSTCTFNPDEDERIIEWFLNTHEEFEIMDIDQNFGFEKGESKWTRSGNKIFDKCARLWPHKTKGEGHFLALLHKREGENSLVTPMKSDNDKKIGIFWEFAKENLNVEFSKDSIFQIINNDLYMLPKGTPDLKGIRVMRSGVLLGTFKKDRFEPSQHLAMTLKKGDFKNEVHLDIDDIRVIKYLKGETVDFQNINDGWCGVFADGFIMGWAKAQKDRLKNKYPATWKME